MTSPYSPYAEAESAPAKWKSGEADAATAVLALNFYLVLDVNVAIHRVFRKKQGLYYWSLILGTWGCAADTIGSLLKDLKPSWGPKIWPLWTVLILCGWSLFVTTECLILYSRLHLVNRSSRIQRSVLLMIILGASAMLIPNWVTIFPAYDVDPNISSIWSPRLAIVDRTSQLGFSLMEIIISGIYIYSLIKILTLKPSIRQRRVMLDLIYVNVIVISIDVLVTILIFINQVNLEYPIQSFSYALKFKLEFVVLNQLMAVAARGIEKDSFEERRYHTERDDVLLREISSSNQSPSAKMKGKNPPDITGSSSPYSIQRKTPRNDYEQMDSEPELKSIPAIKSAKSKALDVSSYDIHLQASADSRLDGRSQTQPIKTNVTATRRRPRRGINTREEEDDEDEEDIGLHMWENRGKLILEVP